MTVLSLCVVKLCTRSSAAERAGIKDFRLHCRIICMPNCKKCSNSFPNRIKIDDKIRVLSNRKYCLDCSPFGYHNTKSLTEKAGIGDRQCECQHCERKYIYNERAGHTLKSCNSCNVNRRRFALKKKMVKYLGSECKMCGYNRCLSAMDFHHRDPKEKKFSISGSHCLKWNIIKLELDKCDLLCCRCHREVEHLAAGGCLSSV